MAPSLVLDGVPVDVAGRALLVVVAPPTAGDGAAGDARAATTGADVVEVAAGADPGALAARIGILRHRLGIPVVVRTARPDQVGVAAAAGAAGIDVRHRWDVPGLLPEAAAAGLVVVVVAGPHPPGDGAGAQPVVVAAGAAGVPAGQLVVEPVTDPATGPWPRPGGSRGPVTAWTADPREGCGPRALARAALAVTAGRRWLRVGTTEGFGPVRDTLAAVERAGARRAGMAG